jgi:hypothetical protein
MGEKSGGLRRVVMPVEMEVDCPQGRRRVGSSSLRNLDQTLIKILALDIDAHSPWPQSTVLYIACSSFSQGSTTAEQYYAQRPCK